MTQAAYIRGTQTFFNQIFFLVARFQDILQSGVQENLNTAASRMGALRGKYGGC
jgi:hypothetical protein